MTTNIRKRHVYRNPLSLSRVLPLVAYCFILAMIGGMSAMVKHKQNQRGQQIIELEQEIATMRSELDTVRVQQAGLLNREMIQQRLQAMQSSLTPIERRDIEYIEAVPPPPVGVAEAR